jgi:hypothetical protein
MKRSGGEPFSIHEDTESEWQRGETPILLTAL